MSNFWLITLIIIGFSFGCVKPIPTKFYGAHTVGKYTVSDGMICIMVKGWIDTYSKPKLGYTDREGCWCKMNLPLNIPLNTKAFVLMKNWRCLGKEHVPDPSMDLFGIIKKLVEPKETD